MQISFSDIISIIALVISSIASFMTYRLGRRQTSLIDDQKNLNSLLLEKEKSIATKQHQAELGASLTNRGSGKYKVLIWNRGPNVAKDISIEFPEGNQLCMDNEIAEKFPLASLEVHQNVELFAIIHNQTPTKHLLRIHWTDVSGDAQTKDVTLTI